MTSKLSWIAFIPFSIAAIAIKIIQLFFMGADGTFFGFNSIMLSYLSIACAVIVLLFAVIFCIIDKRIAPVYLINRNIFAGLFGVLFAVALACEGANRAFSAISNSTFEFFDVTDIILTILTAIVFVVLGLNHFVGNGGVRGLALFYIIPSIWSAIRLVNLFLSLTTVSIAVTDVTLLICYIFTTLFLFNYALIVSLVKSKSPVRSVFIYGLPAIVLLLSFSVYELTDALVLNNATFNFTDNLVAIEQALLALYIFSVAIEVTRHIKSKDQIEIVTESDKEEYNELDDTDNDIINAIANSVTNGNTPDEEVTDVPKVGYNNENFAIDDQVFIEVAQASLNSEITDDYIRDVDTSDFIYGAPPSDDDFVLPVGFDGESDEELPTGTYDESADMYITKSDSTYDTQAYEVSDEDVDEQLDRIDKLILEITEEEFK